MLLLSPPNRGRIRRVCVTSSGIGAGSFKDLDADLTQATLILSSLSDVGGNLFDAAAAYQDSKAVISEAISYRHNGFFLEPMCGQA